MYCLERRDSGSQGFESEGGGGCENCTGFDWVEVCD